MRPGEPVSFKVEKLPDGSIPDDRIIDAFDDDETGVHGMLVKTATPEGYVSFAVTANRRIAADPFDSTKPKLARKRYREWWPRVAPALARGGVLPESDAHILTRPERRQAKAMCAYLASYDRNRVAAMLAARDDSAKTVVTDIASRMAAERADDEHEVFVLTRKTKKGAKPVAAYADEKAAKRARRVLAQTGTKAKVASVMLTGFVDRELMDENGKLKTIVTSLESARKKADETFQNRLSDEKDKIAAALQETHEKAARDLQKAHETDLVDALAKAKAPLEKRIGMLESGVADRDKTIEKLKADLSAAERAVARERDAASDADGRIESLEARAHELERTIVTLKAHLDRKASVDIDRAAVEAALEGVPKTPADALALAAALWPDRLAVLPSAVKSSEGFGGSTDETWDLLRAMATVLHPMLFDGEREANVQLAFQNATGYELSLTEGSDTRAHGELMALRDFTYEGRTVRCEAHVKGRAQNPALRIHFWPDPDRKLIVIGYAGDHLPIVNH